MKKTIIATTLKFIPKSLQNKALCKALNYICLADLSVFHGQVIKLNVSDLKRSWFVTCNDEGFTATKKRKVNLEIKTKFNTAMKLGNKSSILDALKEGDIQLNGEPHLVEYTDHYLHQLDERRLASLSAHLFSFLKIKVKPRLNIDHVQIDDLKSELDIDFIRDEAFKLEKTDLKKALSLMELAHQARPKGPFITKKVAEYQTILNSEN